MENIMDGLKNLEAEYEWTKVRADLLNAAHYDLGFEPDEFYELFDRLCVLLRRKYITLRTVRRKDNIGEHLVRHTYDSRDRKVYKYVEIRTDGGPLHRKTTGCSLELHMMKDVAVTVRGYLEDIYNRKTEYSQAVRALRDTSDFLNRWNIPGEDIMKNAALEKRSVITDISGEAMPSEVFPLTEEDSDD